ncbi:hypothetical protein SUDANB148_02977 [Streptomyces sp. SudanB148_2056]|uniref:hypothetical protein n=1 Tax=Streptomyces sp. SudanB148_2056 TaxID=3035280 RepID=UPI003F5770E6
MKFPFLREDLSDEHHLMYETIDGYVSGPFCEHIEVTGSDCAMFPQGAHCPACTWSPDYAPEAFESIEDYRARMAKVPGYVPPSFAPMTTWSAAAHDIASAVADGFCPECGQALPEDSAVTRVFCSDKCRKRSSRRQ